MKDIFAAIAAAVRAGHKQDSLRQKTTRILQQQGKWPTTGTFTGRTYADVVRALGLPAHEDVRQDGCIQRTWRDGDYHITLLFNHQDICLAVERED